MIVDKNRLKKWIDWKTAKLPSNFPFSHLSPLCLFLSSLTPPSHSLSPDSEEIILSKLPSLSFLLSCGLRLPQILPETNIKDLPNHFTIRLEIRSLKWKIYDSTLKTMCSMKNVGREAESCLESLKVVAFFFWGRKMLIIYYAWLPEYLIWMGIGIAWLVCFSPSVEVRALYLGVLVSNFQRDSGVWGCLHSLQTERSAGRKMGQESKTDTEIKSYKGKRREQSDLYTVKKVRINLKKTKQCIHLHIYK